MVGAAGPRRHRWASSAASSACITCSRAICSATFQSGTTHPGSMTISSDGTKLFVTDYATPRTIELDALNGAQLAIYPASQMEYAQYDERRGIAFLRMNGRPVVWPAFTPARRDCGVADRRRDRAGVASVTSGPRTAASIRLATIRSRRASPDGQFMFTSQRLARMRFSRRRSTSSPCSAAGRTFAPSPDSSTGTRDGVQDACVTADNRVWQSTGYMPMPAYDSHLGKCGGVGVDAHQHPHAGASSAAPMAATTSSSPRQRQRRPKTTSRCSPIPGRCLGTYRHGPATHLDLTYGMRLSGDGSRIVWPMYGTVNTVPWTTLRSPRHRRITTY